MWAPGDTAESGTIGVREGVVVQTTSQEAASSIDRAVVIFMPGNLGDISLMKASRSSSACLGAQTKAR
jgi:hypothetical protein